MRRSGWVVCPCNGEWGVAGDDGGIDRMGGVDVAKDKRREGEKKGNEGKRVHVQG